MLQDIPDPGPDLARDARSCVLETERLTLRRPTLGGRPGDCASRQRSPHCGKYPPPAAPLSAGPRGEFVRATSADSSETVFLIEQNHSPLGMVGIDRTHAGRAGTRLLARRRALGPGLWHRSRARGDRFLLRGIGRRAFDCRRPRRQSGLAQHPREMRFSVERRRTASFRGAGILDPGRLLPPDARGVVVAEELGKFDAAGAVARCIECRPCERRDPYRRSRCSVETRWPHTSAQTIAAAAYGSLRSQGRRRCKLLTPAD